jgi:hypothetical protein
VVPLIVTQRESGPVARFKWISSIPPSFGPRKKDHLT